MPEISEVSCWYFFQGADNRPAMTAAQQGPLSQYMGGEGGL